MTSWPFSENGMPIKGWPKSLLNGGTCSICSAILAVLYLLGLSKYSIGRRHLSCSYPSFYCSQMRNQKGFPLGDKGLEPFSKLREFESSRRLRAIKGITDDNVTEFGRAVDVAVHAVEQVEKAFKVIVGVPCRTRAEGLEQALAFCWCQSVCICHRLPLHELRSTQQPGNRTATCASGSVD